MNYLAHLLLSGDSPDIMLGNYIADSVKGSQLDSFPEGVQRGIRIHRLIDSYTDAHPIVEQSRQRLRPAVRKYAGVVVDVIYDHYLALDWHNWSDVPLQEFADSVYAFLQDRKQELPGHSQRFLYYMVQENILPRYGTIDGIDKVLKGLAHRARFDSGMEHAVHALKAGYADYRSEFESFFPELHQRISKEL